MGEAKVIIVTGANSGVGLDCATRLCSMGHDVVVSVRDHAKGQATIATIKETVPHANVMYLTMELTDPQSVRDFVTKFKETGKQLNVLVNNAGLFKKFTDKQRYTARNDSSLELTMTANCMGPFLLTNLLLDDLKAAASEAYPSRIVNVSSMITSKGKSSQFYIDDLMLAEPGHHVNGYQTYRNSKLALNLWSNQLASSLARTNVVINTVCPGFIPSTNLGRDFRSSGGCFSCCFSLLDTCLGRACCNTKPVSHGGDRVMELVFGDEAGRNCGVFYVYGLVELEAPEVIDLSNQRKIWALCEKYSGFEIKG